MKRSPLYQLEVWKSILPYPATCDYGDSERGILARQAAFPPDQKENFIGGHDLR